MKIRSHGKFAVSHKSKSGRTGSIHARQIGKRIGKAAVIIAAVAIVIFAAIAAARSGDALVIDGDTIAMDRTTIRLWGIDAPEIKQTCTDAAGARYRCGISAARALEDMTIGKDVSCARVSGDRYGRDVARCTVGGRDLGAEMVRLGHAVDYARYSRGAYAAAEAEARAARRGIWAGPFENPESWRHNPKNRKPFSRDSQ